MINGELIHGSLMVDHDGGMIGKLFGEHFDGGQPWLILVDAG